VERRLRIHSAFAFTAPVGRFRPNNFGLYDMHGNVGEWCWDTYEKSYYEWSPVDDPACSSQVSERVVRGGSYTEAPSTNRSATRARTVPNNRAGNLGFRVARSVASEAIGAPTSELGNPVANPAALEKRPVSSARTVPTNGFVSLFNGKDRTGWRVDRGDPDIWHITDGVLVAGALNDWRKMTFLLSERDFSDFILRFEFQLPKNTDSGIVLRAVPGEHHMEVNLRNFDDPAGFHAATAALNWSTSGRGVDYLLPDRPAELAQGRAWNEMEIILQGALLRVSVNGRQVRSTDLRRLADLPGALPSLKRRSGRIGFQSHTGTVRFRHIEVKDLENTRETTQSTPARSLRGKSR
jgi:hypothetical protein